MRASAAALVFLAHLRIILLPPYDALPPSDQSALSLAFYLISRPAHSAVLVFFVLSGHLVLGRIISRLRADTFNLTTYSVDRVTRIVLPLLPALLLTKIVADSLEIPFTFSSIVLHAVGLNEVIVDTTRANPPLWSLAYEIWFYILGGAVALLVGRRYVLQGIAILACIIIVFSILNASYLLFWIFGGITVSVLPFRFNGQAVIGCALAAVGFILAELSSPGAPWTSAIQWHSLFNGLLCVGLGLALPRLAEIRIRQRAVIFLATAGSAVSYSMYVVHYPFLLLVAAYVVTPVTTLSTANVLQLLLAATICILACLAFYFCTEKWTTLLRRTIAERMRAGSTPGLARSDVGKP
ncbi:MAG: acyltransferase family protein [Bauldia sp.]